MAKLSVSEGISLRQLNKIAGTNGFKVLVGSEAGLNGYAVVCLEDCEFDEFRLNGTTSKLSDYGLSGNVVKAGAYLPAPEGSYIDSIGLVSGSCIIYNN